MPTAALFMIAEKWKPPRCLSTNKILSIDDNEFSCKKGWSPDTHYGMAEPWKHYASRKKPDTKGHILYTFIYLKFLEQNRQIHGDRKQIKGGDRRWQVTANEYEVSFWGDEMFWNPTCAYTKPMNCTLKRWIRWYINDISVVTMSRRERTSRTETTWATAASVREAGTRRWAGPRAWPALQATLRTLDFTEQHAFHSYFFCPVTF